MTACLQAARTTAAVRNNPHDFMRPQHFTWALRRLRCPMRKLTTVRIECGGEKDVNLRRPDDGPPQVHFYGRTIPVG